MKRVALCSVIISLVISCAAPSGAVFASEDPVGEQNAPPVSEIDETIIDEVPEVSPASDAPKEEEAAAVNLVATPPVVTLLEEVPEPPTAPPLVSEPQVDLPASPLLVTAYKASGARMHAVQLYNNSSSMVPLDGVSLLYVAGGDEYEIPLPRGWIESRAYVVVAWQGESEHADIEFQFNQIGEGVIETIELYHGGYQPLIVTAPAGYAGELLHRFKSSAGNYTTNTSFATGAPTISGGGFYVLPGVPEVVVLEILVNPRDCTYGLETPDCYDYVKLRNNSSEPLDLGLYRLRSGYSNTNSTAGNTTYFDTLLGPGETQTLTHAENGERVSFSANDGAVWLEDIHGFEAYDLGVSPYVGSNLSAQKGRSWAYDDATDKWQWATPAPFLEENNFAPPSNPGKGASNSPKTLVPCRDDQYRSEETNRCRNIVVTNVLKPCSEGQYRSEETNRCRSIAATAASILKPCADDQFRNPTTNRCRKIASADDVALADCGEGRERNPETNRCRNVLGASTNMGALPFAVEETPEGSERFAGWWVLGTVAALGVGYGVWEWRVELAGISRRAGKFVAGKK